MARQGEERTPPVPAPKELAPYLSFQKLTAPALAAILRVLDTDDAFRARVLAATDARVDLRPPAGWP